MRFSFILTIIALSLCPFLHARETGSAAEKVSQFLAAPELLFTKNGGQICDVKGHPRPDILATAHSGPLTIFLTATAIHYQFSKLDYPEGYQRDERLAADPADQEALRRKIRMSTSRFTVSLAGANPSPRVDMQDRTAYTENFYLPHCPDGITEVATYRRIIIKDVYPGIDWAVYSREGGLKYDFIVHPGADPSVIRLQVSDVLSAGIQADGSLLMKTALGTVTEAAPLSFAGSRKIASSFRRNADGTFGFDVASHGEGELIIDPAIKWATYYGANVLTEARGCATDKAGNVYMCGLTRATSGIGGGGYQNSYSGGSYGDCFLVKFDSTGNRLWGTYYGGTDEDVAFATVVDSSGNVYMSGWTSSTSGITTSGAYQTTPGLGTPDGLLAKFSPSGTRLWATYYGRSGPTFAYSCAVDRQNNVYIAGHTRADTGIASGGFQNIRGGIADGFIAKFDSSGTRLWGSYYGGSQLEYCYGCATDGANNVYLTGHTMSSSGIASPTGFQTTYGGAGSYDAFIVKFNSNGSRSWATYYGTADNDNGWFCATDTACNIYMAGATSSTTGIASGGFQNTYAGNNDAYLVKFDSSGARLWGTYYGSTGGDVATGCATGPAGEVVLAGYTSSTTNFSSNGFQNGYAGGSNDAFLVKFSGNGSRQWASYFGGSGNEYTGSCAIDAWRNIYFCGQTVYTTAYISSNGFQNTASSFALDHGFLLKAADTIIYAVRTGTITGTAICAGASLNVPYTAIGTYSTGNTFQAQLSDAAGSFAVPVTIGSLTSSAGSGTISATLPIPTAGGANYRIRVVSTAPAIQGSGNGTSITISPRPAQPGTISGNAALCAGSAQTYSISAVPGATGYTWSLPSGWTGSSTTTSINAVAGSSGTISVTANNACGPSLPGSLAVTVSPLLTPSLTITDINGTGIYCAGTAASFSATAVAAGSSPAYQWKVNGSIAGTNAPSFSYLPVDGDTVTCIMTSIAPCVTTATATSNAIILKVVPLPQPIITMAGSGLFAGGSYTAWQWYLDGVAITGAEDSMYGPTTNGIYTVEVTDSSGCKGVSTAFPVSGLAVESISQSSGRLSFYPNPATSTVYLIGNESRNIIVRSMDGRLVLQATKARSLDVSSLADGIYLIRILGKDGSQDIVGKLVKRSK